MSDDNAPIGQKSLATRAKSSLARLSSLRISDSGQRAAASSLARFFIAIAALAVISRGASGVTLPVVDTVAPSSAKITESISQNATVTQGDAVSYTLPSGLTVSSVKVSAGQLVAQGDAILEFSKSEVDSAYNRKLAALDSLRLKLEKLEAQDQADSSSLDSAQVSYDRALEDLKAAKDERAALDTSLQSLKSQMQASQSEYQALLSQGADEASLNAAKEKSSQDEQKYNQALSSYDNSAKQLNSSSQQAERKAEDSLRSLDKAKKDFSKSEASLKQTKSQNAVDAKIARLDIKDAENEISLLRALQNSGYALNAKDSGTVSQALQKGQKTTDASAASVIPSGADNYFIATMRLSESDASEVYAGGACKVSKNANTFYRVEENDAVIASVGAPDNNGNVTVEIRLPQGDYKIGDSLTASIIQKEGEYQTTVPIAALHSGSNGYYVYCLEEKRTILGVENVVSRSAVTLISRDSQNAAVQGPLNRNTKIISQSSKTIAEGDRVRINTQ